MKALWLEDQCLFLKKKDEEWMGRGDRNLEKETGRRGGRENCDRAGEN